MSGNVLLVGELISNGGLGLQGDLITVTSLGSNPILAVAMLSTVHNPLNRVFHIIDTEYIVRQIKDCREKPGFDSIKIGALSNEDMVIGIADYLRDNKITEPIVYCPILVSDMGAPLLDIAAIQVVQKILIPLVDVLVVNIFDAEIMTGISIPGAEEMELAAERLRSYGAKAVLITGGLLDGTELYDVFLDDHGFKIMKFHKHEAHLENPFRFGGAWILATAVASALAQKFQLMEAINLGRQYVDSAIGKSSGADGKYQHMCLTHTISKFEYKPEKPAYNMVSLGGTA
jgi:hydroxymethylpyrimidine/phosphomethylpyrimidine kinase